MCSGQLSTNTQLSATTDQSVTYLNSTDLLARADINPKPYSQCEGTLIQALTRKGADANECICGSLTSPHHLMP